MFNNPLKYTDADGNCPICIAILIGVAIGAATNIIQQGIASNWTFKNFNWGSLLADALIGGVSGAVSLGIGNMANAGLISGIEAMVLHGATQSFISAAGAAIKGQDFGLEQFAITFVTAALTHGASLGLGKLAKGAGEIGLFAKSLSQSLGGQMVYGGVIGGITSAALGGNFFEGFATGAILAGMGNLAGKVANKLEENAAVKKQNIKEYEQRKAAAAERQKQREHDEAMAQNNKSKTTDDVFYDERKSLVDKIRADKSLPWNKSDYPIYKKLGWKTLDLFFRGLNNTPEGYFSETQRLYDYINDPKKYSDYVNN